MEKSYKILFDGNKKWVANTLKKDPSYFKRLSKGQSPRYLWIGCSDSRVPANEITGTEPGDIFVHRNIANMVVHTDINMLSVLQYAVHVLGVEHVIVCGHYDCGGIKAAMGNKQLGLIDNWLRNIKDVYRMHQAQLEPIRDPKRKANLLTELNVMEQVYNLAKTDIIQTAWKKGKKPHLHGWVYSFQDGLVKDLNVTLRSLRDVGKIYQFDL